MKKKITTLLISIFAATLSASADFAFSDGFDYTGDAFFEPSAPVQSYKKERESQNHTMPPLKILRLNIQNKMHENALKNSELAPVMPETSIYNSDDSTSAYTSKEIKDDFEEMEPDGFEADEEALEEKGRKKLFSGKKNKSEENFDDGKEDIILDCDSVDYDTPNYLIKATGNVSVNFVNQNTVVKSDILTFDRINNTVKAEGNVRIYKGDRVVTGDYIFVDLNEENALIENPLTYSESIEIRSKKGYVYGDKIIQEQGNFEVTDDYPIEVRSGRRGPRIHEMLTPKDETLSNDIGKNLIKMRADSIKIRQNGDLEVIALKRFKVAKGKHTIFKIPAVKLYTNKNHDYFETNLWEIGYYRGLGLYTGPGWVFGLPKGSALKVVPFVNYCNKFGIGAMGRFHSGTNETVVAYGSNAKRFFVLGRQDLDDNLYLQYAANSYMDEWFLGRRRPKYGVSLVYRNQYSSNGFLIPGQTSSFSHRIEAGYFHDMDVNSHFHKLKKGSAMGTPRFRYMAEVKQSLFDYQNPDKLTAFSVDIFGHLSAALYGTGDTQVVAQLGPRVSWQYKRWAQDLGYFFNAYQDESPFVRYDRYRYGKQYIYLREYFRICKWLTVSWFTNINTTNDAYNGKRMQENTFYISVGPDDVKFHIGYDFARETMRAAIEVMMDAKGANVEYNTFEIKQDKKAKKEKRPAELNRNDDSLAPTQPRVLQRAVVEDVKVTDDVL